MKEPFSAFLSLFYQERQHQLFKNRLSKIYNREVLTLNSGLDAIKLFFNAIGLLKGDEIAIPAYLCFYCGSGLAGEGYQLNFIDVDHDI